MKRILGDEDTWQGFGGDDHLTETCGLCSDGLCPCGGWLAIELALCNPSMPSGGTLWLVEILCSLFAFVRPYEFFFFFKKEGHAPARLHTGCLAKMQSFPTAQKQTVFSSAGTERGAFQHLLRHFFKHDLNWRQ